MNAPVMREKTGKLGSCMGKTVEIPIQGMDCAECVQHVQKAIQPLPGVHKVEVYLATEKAVIELDADGADLHAIQRAVENAGYQVGGDDPDRQSTSQYNEYTRPILTLFGVIFGFVLFIVVAGEWLGLISAVTDRVPWPIGLALVLVGGYPIFRNVIRAALRRQVLAHTLMTVGVFAALLVGEWATAAVIVFLMRAGDYAERFTAERARRAVKDLSSMAPRTARVERDGIEITVDIDQVQAGETVVVRPGEKIPVDGEVISGGATIDQATITGESMPVEAVPGSSVYAATIAQFGSLRVRTTHIGSETTFGRVIKLVESAEANRADVQRIADKFSGYYLPIVATIAALTFLIRRDPMATAAVLVVACSCSFALATPIAMLASIGAGAKRGLLIKGGKYLELLNRADILLIDKTGTLTLGKPQITHLFATNGAPGSWEESSLDDQLIMSEAHLEVLRLAAAAEQYSEHPIAEAVRHAARQRGLALDEVKGFEAIPGMGIRAQVNGSTITVGNPRLVAEMLHNGATGFTNPLGELMLQAGKLEDQGKTVLFVARDTQVTGLLAAADTLRPEVPRAIAAVQALGIRTVELLTGDNDRTAAALVESLELGGHKIKPVTGLTYRANLLPEDKIAIVKDYQARGHTVIMVGDGVNDAPALAQADVGIAMGAAGTDIAIEASHIALMSEDWDLVPQVLRIAQRTMRVVKMNIAFTAVYNLLGLSLAALGFLPPIFAAAAQSIPDLGILANSSRLLKQK
jgi:P-type Cu+ transporter